MKRWLSITVALFAVVYMIAESASGDKRGTLSGTGQSLAKTKAIHMGDFRIAPVTPGVNEFPTLEDMAPEDLAVQSPNFNVDWFFINSGSDITASSASYRSGVSVAQSVTGKANSARYQLDIGFWSCVGGTCCQTVGDANKLIQ